MDFIKLPEDIIKYNILPFVQQNALRLTNKKNWLEVYKKKRFNTISNERSYYRFLMRNNLYFVFDIYFTNLVNIYNNINQKNYKKKYTYKNMVFSNKIDEIVYFSKNYKLFNRCDNIINKNKQKMKYKFKKMRKRNIIWTN